MAAELRGDVLSLADILSAVELLKKNNIPTVDGYYYLQTASPYQCQWGKLRELLGHDEWAGTYTYNYRITSTAWALFEMHARHGKRMWTAQECVDHALMLERKWT